MSPTYQTIFDVMTELADIDRAIADGTQQLRDSVLRLSTLEQRREDLNAVAAQALRHEPHRTVVTGPNHTIWQLVGDRVTSLNVVSGLMVMLDAPDPAVDRGAEVNGVLNSWQASSTGSSSQPLSRSDSRWLEST